MKIGLSSREMEVLRLIIMEFTTNEIAMRLFLSAETVKSHRKSLLNKLHARNVAGIVRKAFEYNIFHSKDILG